MHFAFQSSFPIYTTTPNNIQNPGVFYLQQANHNNIKQKNRFSKKEDELLRQLVNEQRGKIDWKYISGIMNGRTARQCRERYNDYLRPNILNGIWTDEEDQLLIQLYEKFGPRWSIIAQHFPKRSRVNIKNHHKCIENKRRINSNTNFSRQTMGFQNSSSISEQNQNKRDEEIKDQEKVTPIQMLTQITPSNISIKAILNQDIEKISETK